MKILIYLFMSELNILNFTQLPKKPKSGKEFASRKRGKLLFEILKGYIFMK